VKERLITLATALLALGLSLFLLSPPQPPEPKISLPSSEDRGKAGLKGMAEWLRRQGVPVASLRNRYDHLRELSGPPGAGHVLVVSLPAQKDVEKAEWRALQRHPEAGFRISNDIDTSASAQAVLKAAVRRIGTEPRGCACARALKNAIMTAPGLVPEKLRKDLAPIVGQYLK